MAKVTREQRMRRARVRPRHLEDEVLLRRQAVRDALDAQIALGHRFGRCGISMTIRSRTR